MDIHFRAALLALASLIAPAGAEAQAVRPHLAEVSRAIIDETNGFRRANGAGPTAPDAKLTATARDFAQYMARTDRHSHEADGKEPAERAHDHGYAYCLVSENIAFQYSSAGFGAHDLANRLVDGWKRSPGHRKNMLDADATDTGVAVVQSARTGRYYAVQMFGRPQARTIRFRIANASPAAVEYDLGGKSFRLLPRMTRTHQQCRPARLTMRLPGERQATTIRPGPGERYAVEQDASRRYRLRKD